MDKACRRPSIVRSAGKTAKWRSTRARFPPISGIQLKEARYYRAASQASLQIRISSRLADGALRWASTAARSPSGIRRIISATLRHCPDRARLKACSIAADLIISYSLSEPVSEREHGRFGPSQPNGAADWPSLLSCRRWVELGPRLCDPSLSALGGDQ